MKLILGLSSYGKYNIRFGFEDEVLRRVSGPKRGAVK
jgi:hypothetical protein